MNKKEIKRLNQKLLETAEATILTTIDSNGHPISRAVSNLRCKEQFPNLVEFFSKQNDFDFYIVTDTSSQKIKQIRANPKISLYFCTPSLWHGMMLGGSIEIVNEPEIKKAIWQKDWERFYTQKWEDLEFSVLFLKPITIQGWYDKSKFQIEV